MSDNINNTLPENDDAFEREAAEGFAMLGSEEEVEALKAETDLAFAQQFGKAKAPTRYWIWAAAAVVVVGLGISVFSLLQPEAKEDLAQVRVNELEFPTEEKSESTLNASEAEASSANALQKQTIKTPPKPEKGFDASEKHEPVKNLNDQSAKLQSQGVITSNNSAANVIEFSANTSAVSDEAPSADLAKDKVSAKRSNEREEELLAADQDFKATPIITENKKAKASSSAPVLYTMQVSSAAPGNIVAASDSITFVLYPAGQEALITDTKALLKNLKVKYPIDISLSITEEGKISAAKILSKAPQDAETLRLAEIELKKLQGFAVNRGKKNATNLEYRYMVK